MDDVLAGISDPTERLVRGVTRACRVVGGAIHLDHPEILVAARPDIWPSPSAIPMQSGPSGGPVGWNSDEVAYWFAFAARARGIRPDHTYRVRQQVQGLLGVVRTGFVETPAWFIASACSGQSRYVLHDGSLPPGGLFAEHLITMARTLGLS